MEEDANVLSLLSAGTSVVSIFGKSWDLHVKEILNASLKENLQLVYNTVKFFVDNGREVIFDAEHFFDGYKANPEYAMSVLAEAARAGADCLCLCDTNGGALPTEIYHVTKLVCEKFSGIKIGIHCHNDGGCAVANSILAVEAGAVQVQGTFIGIGERCGNTDLSVVIPDLQIKQGYKCINESMEKLSETVVRFRKSAISRCLTTSPM